MEVPTVPVTSAHDRKGGAQRRPRRRRRERDEEPPPDALPEEPAPEAPKDGVHLDVVA